MKIYVRTESSDNGIRTEINNSGVRIVKEDAKRCKNHKKMTNDVRTVK